MRVYYIYSSKHSKYKKIFEYFINELSIWITKD